jgi:hypothetical protein
MSTTPSVYFKNNMPPDSFSPPESWPEYGFIAEPAARMKREIVGRQPQGIRYASWPNCFEEYISDIEPDLGESKKGRLARNRDIIWKRITRSDIPLGWRILEDRPWRIDGFFNFEERPYTDSWNRNARRNLHKWHNTFLNKKYVIGGITFEEFLHAYKKSTVVQKAGTFYIDILARKRQMLPAEHHPELWGVRSIANNEIIAGTALHFFSNHKTSVHECPFMLPFAGKVYAPTGLVNHWFNLSLQRGIRTLITPYLWREGDPALWRGPSDFKTHFGFQSISYPPPLIRFVRGKLF